MGRAPCCDKANVKRGPWSPEEDTTLKNYVETHGTGSNWIALPQKAGLKRCGKSCRLRWLNYLRPGIKHGGFTEEEDNVICSLYKNIGSRWSVIASHLPGRTDNDVKNYWNTKLKKKLLPPQANLSSHNNNNNNNSNNSTHKTTSPSPLTRAVPTIKSEQQYGFGSFSVSAGNSPSSTLTAMDAAGQGFNSHFSSHGHHASSFPAVLAEPPTNYGGSSTINGGYVVSPTQDISAASTSSLTTENSNSYVSLSDNVGNEMDAFLMDLGLGPMDFLGSGGLGLLDRMGDVGPIPVGMAATNLWSNCAASKPQEMYPSFTYS